MGLVLLGFGWGFAEATLFFVVADVGISLIATRRGWRLGCYSALAAAAGATVGGVCLALWAAGSPDTALHAVDKVPSISPTMIHDLRTAMADQSPFGLLGVLLQASVSGVPYKIAAATAPGLGIPLWLLAVLTPLARLPRFLLAAAAGAGVRRVTTAYPPWLGPSLVTAAWLIFYSFYWSLTPN